MTAVLVGAVVVAGVALALGHKRRAFVWGLAAGVLAAWLTRSRQQPTAPPVAVAQPQPPTPPRRRAPRRRQQVVDELAGDHGGDCYCEGDCNCA